MTYLRWKWKKSEINSQTLILCLSLAQMNHPSLTRLYKIFSLLGQPPQVHTTCQFSCAEEILYSERFIGICDIDTSTHETL